MIRLSDYIASYLVEQGVDDFFMLTGNGAMYLNDAIAQSGVNYYCARNEAAAPMMAEAYARVKQSLGAVCVTSGPGSTNAVPGLAEAWADSAPIIVISGQVQRSHTTRVANIPGLRTFGTAEIDIVSIVEPLTKYAVMVEDPESIRYHLEKAVYLATSGRPGPVWLDLPQDIQDSLIDPESQTGFDPPDEGAEYDSVYDAVTRVMELLEKCDRPLLFGGHGIHQAGAKAGLYDLLDTSGIPIFLSRLGHDLIPFSHPQNLGMAGLKGAKYSWAIMESADLVITLGCRMSVQTIGHDLDPFSDNTKVVMVDIDEAELKKPGLAIDVPVRADVGRFMDALSAALKRKDISRRPEWLDHCQTLKRENPMVLPSQQRNPIDLYYFMSRLDALSEERHIFVTDAGSNLYVGGQVYRHEFGQRHIGSSTFGAMGLSIPLAIGASIAAIDKQILAVTGDGSLELNIQELKTMSHYGLDVKLFVINNGGYVSMRNWQDNFFEGRRIEGSEETGTGTLDLAKVAAAFDLDYRLIGTWEEIDGTVEEIMSERGPLLIEVVCDEEQQIVSPTPGTVLPTADNRQ